MLQSGPSSTGPQTGGTLDAFMESRKDLWQVMAGLPTHRGGSEMAHFKEIAVAVIGFSKPLSRKAFV